MNSQKFDFCQTDILNIKCFFIPRSAIEKAHFVLQKSYKMETKVQGTKSFHHLEPVSSNGAQFKQPSEDKFSWQHMFTEHPNSVQSK